MVGTDEARLSFRWHAWVQEEWREPHRDVVVFDQAFDLNEADITPRSDEVGNDDEGDWPRDW